MAVYKHQYDRYTGELTARWQRIMVIPRYAYKRVFHSRFFTIFFVLCFLVPLGGALLIYLRHNLSALEMLQIPTDAMLPINAEFFKVLLQIQGYTAFVLTVFVGPGLVSPDLSNNALPLYLGRPFSKTDYVIGKMSVLIFLQSAITWVPLTLLFLLQSNLAGSDWMRENFRILFAIFAGSWIWIIFLAFLALAVSAWVKWKPVSGAVLFAVFFVGAGFGETIKEIFTSRWGDLFNLPKIIHVIWTWLFFGQEAHSNVTYRVNGIELHLIPIWSAWFALGIATGICLLLLARRIRAYEIVR
jgi:ABC-2 type transport system permease protein